MKKIIINLALLAVGGAAGSAITWKLVKTKYEQIAQEEIDSVKEHFSKKEPIVDTKEISPTTIDEIISPIDSVDIAIHSIGEIIDEQPEGFEDVGRELKTAKTMLEKALTKIANNNIVKKYSGSVKQESVIDPEKPYTIPPDDFDTMDDYDVMNLTCYADGTVTDDYDDVIENDEIIGTIGLDSLNTFGEYKDDVVYVRNDSKHCDYEILKDVRNYSDVPKEHRYPYGAED